jgi:hypothetical protein
VFLNFYKIYGVNTLVCRNFLVLFGGWGDLELSYYKVCCAVMEQCSYLAAGVLGNLGWWGVGRGQKLPKKVKNTAKKVKNTAKQGQSDPKTEG